VFDMMRLSRLVLLVVAGLALSNAAATATQAPADDEVAATLDALLTKLYPADAPGAAVISVRDGRTVLRKAYGMADLELGVPLQPDMVFRIGSMTKQFTAVAVLLLAEEGKLAVSDPITKFLPDYPTGGKTITVEQLLTHTSGIKSYTDMPDFLANIRKDYTTRELIDHFKDQPAEFEPGAQYKYDNSGYFLLGAIVEQASRMGSEAFLKQRIFDVVGMKQTSLDSTSRVIPRRARGYSKTGDTWTNADWISMTQPYAAGAIVSTVDDLAAWDAALYTGKLLRPETLATATTPHRLKDGKPIEYGYGWQSGQWEGFTVIQHGGGINGFVSMGIRVPERKAYVAVLSNRTAEPFPLPVAQRLATYLLDKPWNPKRVAVPEETLKGYAGVYRGEGTQSWTVSVEDGKLFSQPGGGGRAEALPLSESEFFFEASLNRLRFERDASGKAVALVRQGFGGLPRRAERTDETPKQRKEVALSPEQLDRYVGRYQLAPGFVVEITREGGRVYFQATGQAKLEIFAESETEFFLKLEDAQRASNYDRYGANHPSRQLCRSLSKIHPG
jgi:CubicO group peptidase (beta-lactamase class C family)